MNTSKLAYEYNEYVIGYVVTDLETGRTANAQFNDCGNGEHVVAFGCEGDDTHREFNEEELEEMKNWLRSHDDVRALENAYDAAYSLPRDEYGQHPLVEIMAQGVGVTESNIYDLAKNAE